jgi:hypothetical protein
MYLQSLTTEVPTQKGWINSSNLIIFAFAVVFYSRIFCTVTRAPSVLNLAHFAVVPFVLWVSLTTLRLKDRRQIEISYSLLFGLAILLVAAVASALFNSAGLINAIVSFMLLGEPFIFLLAIASIPLSVRSYSKIKNWFLWSALINFVLAALQKPLIDAGKISAGGFNGTDGCGGVFFVTGAGNYVSASVTFACALYFLANEKTFPLWGRFAVILAAFWQLLFSDSKQIILAYLVAWGLLIVLSSKDIGRTIKLLLAIIVFGYGFYWCIYNLEEFSSFTAWARPDLYGPDGEAWYAKFYGTRLIESYFQSPLNQFFGLGPGHTVSRLGGWFLRDYADLLIPLGATVHRVSNEIINFTQTFWLVYSSSMFNPIFGWAGIWGDLGWFGVGAYLHLGYLSWKHFAFDDSLKITLLAVFVMGFIFTQMEEPGFMLSIALMLGLAWHERRLRRQTQKTSALSLGQINMVEGEKGYIF